MSLSRNQFKLHEMIFSFMLDTGLLDTKQMQDWATKQRLEAAEEERNKKQQAYKVTDTGLEPVTNEIAEALTKEATELN